MSPKRTVLLVALLLVLFAVVVVSQACCGEVPNYFIDVEIVGQPDCSYGRHTGRVNWTMDYRLPSGENMRVYSYGDGVSQSTDFYGSLPHTPGYQVDTLADDTIWTWQGFLLPQASYKVRVQFEVYNPITGFEDWALIVFDCTSHGVRNVVVHNG